MAIEGAQIIPSALTPEDDLPEDDMPSIRHRSMKDEIVSLKNEVAQLQEQINDIKTDVNTIKEMQQVNFTVLFDKLSSGSNRTDFLSLTFQLCFHI